ncbi:MAG: alpha-glucan phosphorylase [Rhodocyclales bacterium]|nr:alpha-glucan phosphorylase [Rhodocyclales bacterium]
MQKDVHIFQLEVRPTIPSKLSRLEELAGNLWYGWDRPTRTLFARLHPALWNAVGHSPKAMLKRIDEQRLLEAAADPVYLNSLNRVLSAFDSYQNDPQPRGAGAALGEDELIAYFCAEFGFHASLPIYSGGLGILAGDHCKAASDNRLPFVAVGLLYRQGYFSQMIDKDGTQQAAYADSDFEDLPINPVLNVDASELLVQVPLVDHDVIVKVWEARIGHIRLFLLDTDLPINSDHDRDIAHQLYGGDRTTRIEQEIILGIGGVRALTAVGLKPTVWHINEGHAAFLLLERIRALVSGGLTFEPALEAVAANTVFTTHTPVPAGHDHFPQEMINQYFSHYVRELGINNDRLLALGTMGGSSDFNMTALAVRGSRFQNGVSRIHGRVSSQILSDFWPDVPREENPVTYVTNGVHVPTFLASQWRDVFDRYLGFGWSQRIHDAETWASIDDIPDHIFWNVRQDLKSQMLHLVRHRVTQQHYRNHGSQSHLDRMLRLTDPDSPRVLTIGFGRRFATYKRATLLFRNLDYMRKLVSDADRPILFLFAGKAHPADRPGQDLIKTIHAISHMPEFLGRVLLVEGYDLRLARRMVSGVDVWLNTPIYPLEASGTSGMKAAMNGVLNLSVLDGWWGEGYDGKNGWAIPPSPEEVEAERRDDEEAQTLYELLQDQIIPMYYRTNNMGHSPEWIKMAKHSIASLLPTYSASRMVKEYINDSYLPASRQGHRYVDNGFQGAVAMAEWKARVLHAWPGVALRAMQIPQPRIDFGEGVALDIAVSLNGLTPQDVVVELLLTRGLNDPIDHLAQSFALTVNQGDIGNGETHYSVQLKPEWCGRLDYRIRIYPHHELLTHPLEMGLMRWV